ELKLEIDQLHLPFGKEWLEDLVDRMPGLSQLAQDARCRDTHQAQMIVIDKRVTWRIVLIIEFNDRRIDPVPLLQSEPFGQTASHDVSDHDFNGDDSDSFREHFPVIQSLYKMCPYPALLQEPKKPLGDLVVHDAFVDDSPALLCVEGRRIVLEILHDLIRISRRKNLLRLAFVKKFAGRHDRTSTVQLTAPTVLQPLQPRPTISSCRVWSDVRIAAYSGIPVLFRATAPGCENPPAWRFQNRR